MINRVILLLVAAASLSVAEATVVTLAGTRTSPFAETSQGLPVAGGLVRVGALVTSPASDSVEDIDFAFAEFASFHTSPFGRLGQSVTNFAGTQFNGLQIYIWIFDAPTIECATEHGVFTVTNPGLPASGDPWFFPVHTGILDSATIALSEILSTGDFSTTPGAGVSERHLRLTPVVKLPDELVISEILRVGGRVRLSMERVPGWIVGVEYSMDMSPGSWIELGNFSHETGLSCEKMLVFTDPDEVRVNRPRGFYRAFLRVPR